MAGYLLLESGDRVLLESGTDQLTLEDFVSARIGTVTVAARGLTGRFKVRGMTV